jgi:two-component system, NarL family, nitrate/nitrite response regulator NarL
VPRQSNRTIALEGIGLARTESIGMPNSCVETLRILLIDDHEIVRSGLRLLVESQPGMQIVGEVGACADALTLAASEQPDIILLDLDFGDGGGLDLLPQLLAEAPSARVLVLTETKNTELHGQALRLGAMGLVQKGASTETLFKAIRKVHAGELWFDRVLMGRALSDLTRTRRPDGQDSESARIETLTKRELEVVNLVVAGLRNRAIGERLFISETTVRHHLTSIYEKLAVADRFELIVLAYRRGLVPREE